MPGLKRPQRGRRPIRRRRAPMRKRTAKVPRILRPKTMRFKRDLEETLLLSGATAPEGWTLDGNFRVFRNLAWSLGSIGNNTDFTNLFRQYRIKGARMRFYFSTTESGSTHASSTAAKFTNSQLMVRMAPNQRGEVETLDNSYWQQIQAKKYRLAYNGGKPVDIYMPLKQRDEVASSTGTSYAVMSPKFISTNISNVPHYGLNIAIERVDGQGFTGGMSNYQYVKVITTLYFEMRGVE